MPKRYRVRITRHAEKDVQEIYDYILSDNPPAAQAFVDQIEHQILSLETMPLRCPVIPEAPELGRMYRHLLYGDYRTIFLVKAQTVTIYRVIHRARLLDLSSLD